MRLTSNESHYVLTTLMRQGKVRASQVKAALRGRKEEIRQLRERLDSLESLGQGSASAGRPPRRGRRRARRKLSPRVRSLRRLQGKYMGFVRRLNPAEKARVRAVRKKNGMRPAIRLAASLSRKTS